MNLKQNAFKAALKEGRPQIGLWCSLASHISTEVVAGSGFDWLMLDTEHAPNELPMVLSQLQAIKETGVAPLVRPAWNDPVLLKRLLDIGAQTVLLPFVQTSEEARAGVAATRYPPHGIRGVAMTSRANGFGRVKDYYDRANDEICVLVQVETRQALKSVAEIARVDGVDGVFIGPSDLAADIGHLGKPSHPEVQNWIERGIGVIRGAGKAAGVLAPIETEAKHWLDTGCTFIAVGSDIGVLARGTETLANRYRNRQ
ncbi:HpcH/HpaI aldolase/citrate lyase family protein [Mesorhizobium sp.]|uniref:HpcH/HpaI aldolase/citrate lyase family protein n=1 Tax=Mesorhizobium sp. TaxID=1871066 RepID=UPI000FE99938|nr:HpcH/HpaI aldolase/citrate lyase family protein [Mesorhizobium sp.]RWI87940.1 MAG: hypothetical protein EOR21_27780 [Mesorhizobium sp.]